MKGNDRHNPLPVVSVVIPMLNEIEAIKRCIHSILRQNYPPERIEVVVVDGMSQDGSRKVVEELAGPRSNMRLYDNPDRITPKSLNIGIRKAKGEVIIILGAHTQLDENFVRLNIKYMHEKGVKCVGGTQINTGNTFMQRAIGHAMGSAFGIPSAPYRFHKKQKYVDTVVYAAYQRQIFDEIGYFDEEMHISEDAELNWRIRKAGYKILYSPDIVSYYYPRRNIWKLVKQFFNYGILRVNVIKKHRDAVKPIHLVPPLFVLTLTGLGILNALASVATPLMKGLLALYLIYLLLASVVTGIKAKSIKFVFILPFIFMAMQLSWGLGFIIGTFKTYK